MHAASIHHGLAVKEFQVGRDEDAIFLQCSGADLLGVVGVGRNFAVNAFLLQHPSQFRQVLVDDEPVGLPHGRPERVVRDQRRVVRLATPPVRVAVAALLRLLLALPLLVLALRLMPDLAALARELVAPGRLLLVKVLVVEQAAAVVLLLDNDVAVVQGSNVLLYRRSMDFL